MKNQFTFISILVSISLYFSCRNNDGLVVSIPDFDYTPTESFQPNLSDYSIFQGDLVDLTPSNDYHLMELSSTLFTDYTHKQRLIKVPEGTELNRIDDSTMDFPDGTILVKTFYYYNNERDTSLGKNVLETRLMIKNLGSWNVATYVWNENQTDASLNTVGADTQVNWVDENGDSISTIYHIPDENECIACHQSNSNIIPLGTTLRNLNREVERNGATISQLTYFQSIGTLNNSILPTSISQIVDYENVSASLEERARAYLHMNCAHCHNPNGWEESAREDIDLRYETALNETGMTVGRNQNQIIDMISEGEMPYIGTTLLDLEGIDLVVTYIQGL